MYVSTNIEIPQGRHYDKIVNALALYYKHILQDVEQMFPDNQPVDLTSGMIVGYLRGLGYSWQESFVFLYEYLNYIQAKQNRGARRTSFKNEAITCSVGCSEFLYHFLRLNKNEFDHIIVVTDMQDVESKRVAENAGATVLTTDSFYDNGSIFDRGKPFNEALGLLKYNDWVTFIDVDIVLLEGHNNKLAQQGLYDNCFYGLCRHNLLTDKERTNFLSGLPFDAIKQADNEWGFGYYQLFNINNPVLKEKPIYPSANDVYLSDFYFRKKFGPRHSCDESGRWFWDMAYQIELPWHCYHLGSDSKRGSLTLKYANK